MAQLAYTALTKTGKPTLSKGFATLAISRPFGQDGELEDPHHEVAPIPFSDAESLRAVFRRGDLPELPQEVRL